MREMSLDFRTVPGEHMRISKEELEDTFKEFFGPTQKDKLQVGFRVVEPEDEMRSPGLVVQGV